VESNHRPWGYEGLSGLNHHLPFHTPAKPSGHFAELLSAHSGWLRPRNGHRTNTVTPTAGTEREIILTHETKTAEGFVHQRLATLKQRPMPSNDLEPLTPFQWLPDEESGARNQKIQFIGSRF